MTQNHEAVGARRVLVTGATGLLSSLLADRLVARGDRMRGVRMRGAACVVAACVVSDFVFGFEDDT
jgi:nucleoside-diphosphate-sugar epimerase